MVGLLYKFFVEERSVIERNRALKQVGHLFQLQLSRACKLSYRAVAVSSFVLDAANAKLNSFSFLEKVAGAFKTILFNNNSRKRNIASSQ